MVRTRQRKPAPAEAAEAGTNVTDEPTASHDGEAHTPQEDTQDSRSQQLRFNEALSWRAGRPIAVSDLLSRLQTLFAELCELDQNDADRDSLTPKAQELAGPQLLAHKDKGVRAWSLCCIVKMFHLLAPNAPYKAGQLKDIFTLFAAQVIPAFADSTDPYLQQYVEILTSFAKDKSVLLLLDIPNSDNLTVQVFQSAFDVMAGSGKAERVSKTVEYQLTALLADIVQEAETLSNDVIDVILAQFLRADTDLTGVELGAGATSPAYDMARAVCNSCTANMIRYVSSYFSSVLFDASEIAQTVKAKPRGKKRKHDVDDDDVDDTTTTAPTADDFQDAEKAHRLLRELWRSSPDVVQGVIPQIEAEISAEDAQLRVMAVQAVGDMVSGIGATGLSHQDGLDPAAWPSQSTQTSGDNRTQRKCIAPYSFSKVYPECYQAFTDRVRDKSSAVRATWVTGAGRIFSTNAGGMGLDSDQEARLLQLVKDCSKDSDEKVRIATIESLSQLDYATLIDLLSKDGGMNVKGSLLDSLAERIKDLRPPVRAAAIVFLAKLWGVAAGAIAQGDAAVQAVVDAVPSRILDARYLNQPDVNYNIPRAIHDLLLPTTFPPVKSSVAEAQTTAQPKASAPDADAIRAERILIMSYKAKYLSAYLDRCELAVSSKKDSDARAELEKIIAILVQDLRDVETATAHLRQFAKQNDKRNFQLVRFCLAPDSDYRKVIKAMKELSKRIEASASPLILEALLPLLKTASILIYNRSHVPTFMRFARTDERGLSNAANKLIKHIAETSSEVFKVHAAELCKSLQESQPSESTSSSNSAVFTLKTCVGFARRFPAGMPKDRAFYQAMMAYALYGSPPKTAKHAISIIITAADKKELLVDNILKTCLKNFKYGEPHFLSRLAAVAQLQLLANDQAWVERDAITSIAVKDILGAARTSIQEHDPEWSVVDDYDDDLTAKLLAIKILVNGLRGKVLSSDAEGDLDDVRAAATPVYRLLNTLIEREGELTSKSVTPKHHRAQLRLAAGISLLKLSNSRVLDKFLVAADFNRLARLCQDPLPEVRAAFAKGLRKYLGRGRLPLRFLALAFLFAFEPNKDTKQNMETWIKARAMAAAKCDDTVDPVLEAVFPRLLSLLAHHSDFSEDVNDLQDTVHYLVFYLMNVATEANLPVLYSIAQRLKTVQDGIDPSKSNNLYIVSDVTEATIRAYNEEKGWVLQMSSEKIRLPSGLFTRLPNDINAQELAEKRFIPDDMVEMIPDLVRASLKPRRRKTERAAVSKKPRDTTDDSVLKSTKKQAKKRRAGSETPEPKSTKKTKATKAIDDSTRRRSSRGASNTKSYIEMDSDEEDEELERWNDDEENKENHEQVMTDTPPTSEPVAEDAEMAAISSPPTKTKSKPAAKPASSSKRTSTRRTSARRAQQSSEFDIDHESVEKRIIK
ncbi:hypothetical protein AMS68_005861 [Peltaster fructicola]|uniref:Sister chromatid cohesion protein n=1 Tax=Peltaster fructicola TaxID=286661 RepID=A0A6H0Y021_9PEZI|nr:hypothetical protein AMS68_005861 [Peltaster fructicola]